MPCWKMFPARPLGHWLVAIANFYGINTSITANFKPPTRCHRNGTGKKYTAMHHSDVKLRARWNLQPHFQAVRELNLSQWHQAESKTWLLKTFIIEFLYHFQGMESSKKEQTIPGPDAEKMKFTLLVKGQLLKVDGPACMGSSRKLLSDISLKCFRKDAMLGFHRLPGNAVSL